MNPMGLIVRGAVVVSAVLATTVIAQSTVPAGPAPGSQSSFVNGSAAARNEHAPRIWLSASVAQHRAFLGNAFDGPNITAQELSPDFVSGLKAQVITDALANANLALFALSQQFLADLAANQNNTADPIGEGPLDDFFGDVSGTSDGSSTTPDTSGNVSGELNGDQVDDLFGDISGQSAAGLKSASDAAPSDGSTLDEGQVSDFFGDVSARAISPFDEQLDWNVVEMTAPEAAPAE